MYFYVHNGLLVLTCEQTLPGPLPVELAAGHEGAADGADELGLLAAAGLEEEAVF